MTMMTKLRIALGVAAFYIGIQKMVFGLALIVAQKSRMTTYKYRVPLEGSSYPLDSKPLTCRVQGHKSFGRYSYVGLSVMN